MSKPRSSAAAAAGRCRGRSEQHDRDASADARTYSTGAAMSGWLTRRHATLDLTADAVTLTEQLVEHRVGQPERAGDRRRRRGGAARPRAPRRCTRHGNTVVARTDLGRDERVVIAGHLDTVPLNDNLPGRARDGDLLHGLGTCDMKGGDAVMLRLAATMPEPNRDVTFIFYEAEEIEAEFNGLRPARREQPRADGGRLRDPDGAVERGRRGRLPGHPAGRGPHPRRARPLGPQLDGRQRHPRPRRVLAGSTAYEPARRSSTGWSTTRASTRSASAAASRAT